MVASKQARVDGERPLCYKEVLGIIGTTLGNEERRVSIIERRRELKRRRHRRKKVALFARKLQKATVSEKTMMAEKLRGLTPGAETVIERWELEKR